MITLVVGTDGSDLAIQAAAAGLSLMRDADRIVIVAIADTVDPSLAEDATGHASSTMTPDEVEEQHREARGQSQAAVEATKQALESSGALTAGRVETFVVEGEPVRRSAVRGGCRCDCCGRRLPRARMDSKSAAGLRLRLRGSQRSMLRRRDTCVESTN